MKQKNDKPLIELKNVWKTYQMGDTKVHALRGMNLKVYKGEFLAIMVHPEVEKAQP